MDVHRHFLSWNRALLPQAVDFLAAGWNGQGALDLSNLLVVVPTRQSGRRLREALAEYAAARSSGVLSPRVLLPEDLVTPSPAAAGLAVASRLESQLAWAEILRTIDLNDFRAVFPVDPPSRNFDWAARLAGQFQRLQAALTEIGLRMGDVVAKAGAGLPEAARWAQLGELERRYDAKLATLGRRDVRAATVDFARAAILPEGITRIVVIATPDPLALAVEVLAQFAAVRPVHVVIYGPSESEGSRLFDDWGRPSEDAWRGRPLALADFYTHVHLCADAAEQAVRIAELAGRYRAPQEVLAIGIADAEVTPAVEFGLRSAGGVVFNPEGRPRRRDGLFALFTALAALVRDPAFDHLQALVRCPDFIVWLELAPAGEKFPIAAALAQLDELHARHLPATLAAAMLHAGAWPDAQSVLKAADTLRTELIGGVFPDNASAALSLIFGARQIPPDDALVESAGVWMDLLRGAAQASASFPDLTTAEWWDLVLAQFGENVRFDQRSPDAIELLGWLELLWEDASHLVVAGFNDGRVPEAVTGDVFLPEALRVRLGLKTNGARFARDAYQLAALSASRCDGGRLDLLVGKVAASGDPLRPSRLLLQCDETELPRRVAALFRPAEATRPGLPWRRAWPLEPPQVAPPRQVSVTALRDYLHCPFRFYLKHALKMRTVDPFKSELDALDFGTLCHAALEALGREMALRESTDAALLREFLLARFDHVARERFGVELTLPLIVQLESARQRLGRAAEIQAQQRAAGWLVEQVERKFEFALGPITVRGQIDRVERNVETGAVRVLDFKTSDKAVPPTLTHLRALRRGEKVPEWGRFLVGDREQVWMDLQLPLYLEAMTAEYGVAVEAGYFNLPKAVGETAITMWPDYDATWREAARVCAEGVAAGIAQGIFWPPAEVPAREEEETFVGLFHHGTEDSVHWRGVT